MNINDPSSKVEKSVRIYVVEMVGELAILGDHFLKLGAYVLALLLSASACFAVFGIYDSFHLDFDRPLTLNILGEGFLIFLAGMLGLGLIIFAWGKANEYEPDMSISWKKRHPKQ